MDNWVELTKDKYNDIWDRFYSDFDFKPSVYKKDWPTYNVRKSFITYDISNAWKNCSFVEFEYRFNDLHEKVLDAFTKCTSEDEIIYALDWQHRCYGFNPRLKMETIISEFAGGEKIEKWKVQVYPNGDYYIFLPNDFRWGLLGHPWEKKICIFGDDFIDAISNNCPIIFNKIAYSKF